MNVRAEVANTEGKLSPGQFVQVRVELPEENNVLALPQTALTSSLYGDYIFVVQAAKPEPAPAAAQAEPAAESATEEKPAPDAAAPAAEGPALVLAQVFVKPGRRNEGLVEILQGIAPGDQVVTAGQNRLFNGMSVTVDNTIDPAKPADLQQAAAQ